MDTIMIDISSDTDLSKGSIIFISYLSILFFDDCIIGAVSGLVSPSFGKIRWFPNISVPKK